MVNGRYGYILGIEIQTDHYTAVAADMLGEVILSDSGSMRFDADIVSTFQDVTARLRASTRRVSLPLIGIGVGTAGIIDPHKGIIQKSNPLNIREPVDFYRAIASLQEVPVP